MILLNRFCIEQQQETGDSIVCVCCVQPALCLLKLARRALAQCQIVKYVELHSHTRTKNREPQLCSPLQIQCGLHIHTSTSCNYALALILAPPSIILATARSCGKSSPRARCLHSLLGFPRILSRIGPLYSPGGTRVPFCKISIYPSRASASAAARASGMSSRQAAMPKLRGASEGQQDLSGPRAVQRSRMAERSLSCIAVSSMVRKCLFLSIWLP